MVLQLTFYLDVQDYTIRINSHSHSIPPCSQVPLYFQHRMWFSAPQLPQRQVSGDNHDAVNDDKDHKKHKKCKKHHYEDVKHKKYKTS